MTLHPKLYSTHTSEALKWTRIYIVCVKFTFFAKRHHKKHAENAGTQMPPLENREKKTKQKTDLGQKTSSDAHLKELNQIPTCDTTFEAP